MHTADKREFKERRRKEKGKRMVNKEGINKGNKVQEKNRRIKETWKKETGMKIDKEEKAKYA